MTNKELQNILQQFPDDYIICIDNVFGWETIHNMVDPHLYVNSDIGQIEIEPADGYRKLWNEVNKELPKEDDFVMASYISKFNNKRMYEPTYYPEPPLTDMMDKWFKIPNPESEE